MRLTATVNVLRDLQTLWDIGAAGSIPDAQLVAYFVDRTAMGAEYAFVELVRRHGPMVLATCRRITGNRHDADDAFQATFLVLVKKARRLTVRNSLGPWLHEVARRVALEARAKESQLALKSSFVDPDQIATSDRHPNDCSAIIHEELDRLPNNFRLAVVLCDLEGSTIEAAARHLGWPLGTVKSRLTRGRARLREALERRGVAPASVSFTGLLAREPLSNALIDATIHATLTTNLLPSKITLLAQGVIPTMGFMAKYRFIAVLSVLFLVSGVGVLAYQGPAPRQVENASQDKRAVENPLPTPPGESKKSAHLHAEYLNEISEYNFYLDPQKQRRLALRREPLLRYPSPADFWGEIYLWTDRGRPAVVASVFGGLRRNGVRRICHEFHSLAPVRLFAVGGATGWQPEEDGAIKFNPVPDAPEPAKDMAARLLQMREIVAGFSSSMIWSDKIVDLKTVPDPLYRYEVVELHTLVFDGGLFACSAKESNDPEILLLIEAQRNGNKARWNYAPVRFTNRTTLLRYKGEEVWRAEGVVVGVFDGVNTKRYGVFEVKTIPDDADGK